MEASCLNSVADMWDEVFHMIELCLDVPAERHSLSESSMKGLCSHIWMHGCVFSAAHYIAGHLVVVMYIHSAGVLNKLQASRVMLLALHCFYIPSPVGHWWPTRANHGSIMFQFCCRNVRWGLSHDWTTVCLDVPAERHSLSASSMRVLLRHVDAWLCILSSPLHSWASCCRDVYP